MTEDGIEMEKFEETIFYTLEKSIKTYRQFAQKQINKSGFDITIDQWLLLKTIQDYPDCSQNQIAEKVFKDFASVTRIIELLVKKEYLNRQFRTDDRRRFELSITELGHETIEKVQPLIKKNRRQALKSFSKKEIEEFKKYLGDLIANCQ